MRLHRGATVALLALAAASTAGCGTKAATAETLVRTAPGKTTAAKTARLSIVITTNASNAPSAAVNADGVADLATGSTDMTMKLQQLGSGDLHMITVGSTMYIQFPQALRAQLGGKPFAKVDLDAIANKQGIDLGALRDQRPDPGSQLSILQGAGADFKKVGTETVRGASTTHYHGTVNLDQAVSAASVAAKSSVQKIEQQLGTNTIPLDVWLDKSGRLRKMSYHFDLGKVAAANGASNVSGDLTETMEMYDYGVQANIAAPPADQVSDLTALIANAKSR